MPANDLFASLETEPKALKRQLWKDKLFAKGKNNPASTDQQIEAFLGSSRGKIAPQVVPTEPSKEYSTLQAPPSQDSSLLSTQLTTSPITGTSPPGSLVPTVRKSRKPKGLRVTFSDGDPEVIGEGGDETETPTIEISRRRIRQRSQAPNRSDAPPSRPETGTRPPDLRLDTSFANRNVRRPEQVHAGDDRDSGSWRRLLINDPQDSDFLLALSLVDSGSRLSFRASADSNSFARRVRAKMQAEEGQALHSHYRDSPSPANEALDVKHPSPVSPNSLSPHTTSPTREFGSSTSLSTFQLTSNSVMQRSGNASPRSPNIPFNLTPGSLTQRFALPRQETVPQQRPSISDYSVSRDNGETSRSPRPPKHSLKSIAGQFEDTALNDLKTYLAPYNSLYRLSAENRPSSAETTLAEWIRAALWWFIRGKSRLETYARSRAPSPGGDVHQRSPSHLAKQAVIDVGKAMWINETIVPQHWELNKYDARSMDAVSAVVTATGDKQMTDLLNLHQGMMRNTRSLAMSIKKNNIFAAFSPVDQTATWFDNTIWLQYPSFAPDVSAVLSGTATRSMLAGKPDRGPRNLAQIMPLSDSSRYFTYGSMFVEVRLMSQDDHSQQIAMPCLLSIIRDRHDWYVVAAITSQNELVNIMIQSDRMQGPTWEDVDWQVKTHSMRVKLPRHFELLVIFQEDDFKMIWNIVRYTQETQNSLFTEEGESLLFETTLKVFHYMDPKTSTGFPSEPIERCQLRLFERSVEVNEGIGSRKHHRGFRLFVLTGPQVKTLSSIRHVLAYGAPIVFSLLRGETGAPALLLKVTEDGRTRSILITFNDVNDRLRMHSLLLGIVPGDGEFKLPELRLRSFVMEQSPPQASSVVPLQFPASKVTVIDGEPRYVDHGYGPTVLSENLRVFIATDWGSVTDRINLGPGELKINVDVKNKTLLSLFRPGQQDLTISLADNLVSQDMSTSLTNFLQTLKVTRTTRRLEFCSVEELHAFQLAMTGFKVLFDNTVSSFSIVRRRMVVPIHKKWEATCARVQVVQNEKVIQLLAFFSDFSHGKCMNFVLKSTDNLESFSRSGKFGTRIVDAKFALPKTDDDPASGFVSLDTPDFAIEHDDVAIIFDAESDRKKFEAVVPGTLRETSRMGSLRR